MARDDDWKFRVRFGFSDSVVRGVRNTNATWGEEGPDVRKETHPCGLYGVV